MNTINLHSQTARTVIHQEYGGSKNFITPDVIGHVVISKGVLYCEVSKGIGMRGNCIYGISVVEKHKDGTTSRRTDLSKAVDNMAQVYSELEAMQEIFS